MLAVEHNWPTAFKGHISALPSVLMTSTYGDGHDEEVECEFSMLNLSSKLG